MAGEDSSLEACRALQQLCATYWYPLYAYVRRHGHRGPGTAVADGYFVMLPPLSKGEHTIRIKGSFHFDAGELGPAPVDFRLDVTCHVNGTPGHGDEDGDCDKN